MLIIGELLAEVGLKLACGEPAAPVRAVHSTELVDPTPWLKGGELLLSTGIQLDAGDPVGQRAYIERLAAHGIAGLGFGTGFSHQELPAALVDACREYRFALFEVPYDVPFMRITEAAFERLVSEQYDTLRRITRIHAKLERLVLEERGLDALLAAVAAAIGGSAGVLSAAGEPLSWQGPAPPPEPGAPPSGPGTLSLAVLTREPVRIIGICAAGSVGAFERLVLQGSASIVGLELMRLRAQRDTERRLAGDVLAEVLTGRLHPDELRARLRPFGIGAEAAVLAFDLADPGGSEFALDRALERAGAAGSLVVSRGALLCAVIDGGAGDPIELARIARRDLGVPARAAASRIGPTEDLRRSFHEARCALEAVRFANGSAPEVASHADLGAFELLLSARDDDALRSFAEGVLSEIDDADKGYGDELLRSLDAFIEHNGHWERAAAALPCHRHTLRYRIRRAEELSGRNLSQARDRIEFWLALRAREMVR